MAVTACEVQRAGLCVIRPAKVIDVSDGMGIDQRTEELTSFYRGAFVASLPAQVFVIYVML